MAVKCQCGYIYNEGFKFCPECALPNPKMTEKNPESVEEAEKKRGFVKVGESNLTATATAKIVRNSNSQKKVVPEEEYYEDEEEPQPEEKEEDLQDEEYYEDDVEENTEEEIAQEGADDIIQQPEMQSVKNPGYDPNYDGYYDDRLPLIANEITKTNYMDVIFKTIMAVIFLIGIILYCIYFLRV